jgi:hypothetical protein
MQEQTATIPVQNQETSEYLRRVWRRGTAKSGGNSPNGAPDAQQWKPAQPQKKQPTTGKPVPPAAVKGFADDLFAELDLAQNFDVNPVAGATAPPRPTTGPKTPKTPPRSKAETVAKSRDRLRNEEDMYAKEMSRQLAAPIARKINKQVNKSRQRAAGDPALLSKIDASANEILKPSPKQKKDRVAKAVSIDKLNQDLDDKLGDPLGYLEKAGVGTRTAAKALDATLLPDSGGDDIASAAGQIAASSAGAALGLLQAFKSFNAYSKTDGAAADQNLSEGLKALGDTATHLVNVTRGALNAVNAADPTGGQLTEAVPVLGAVAVVPTLLEEINDLRSAATRLAKQQKVYDTIKDDENQAALAATLKSMMAIDKEAIGKGVANVMLDFTKVAGHAVNAGGVSAPIGTGMVVGAGVLKKALAAAGTVEDFVDAHHANEARKKLDGQKAGADTAAQQEDVAGKLIKRDPRLAAQNVIEQALVEARQGGGPAVSVLKSFGIEVSQIQQCAQDGADDRVVAANIREMRQKMLDKLHKEDETAPTPTQKWEEYKEKIKAYFDGNKKEDIGDYAEAKNLIGKITGEDRLFKERGAGWELKMRLKTSDAEAKKKELYDQVQILLDEGGFGPDAEVDGKNVEATLRQAAEKLKPRGEKATGGTAAQQPQAQNQNPQGESKAQRHPKEAQNHRRILWLGARLRKQPAEVTGRLTLLLKSAIDLHRMGAGEPAKFDEAAAQLDALELGLDEAEAKSNAWAAAVCGIADGLNELIDQGDEEIAGKARAILGELSQLPANGDYAEILAKVQALQSAASPQQQ